MGGGGRSCTVIGCLSRSSTQKDKHFYHFPSEQTLKEVWKIFTRRGNDYEVKKSSYICEDHFDPSCFVFKKKQICLAKNTIPTIFHRTSPEGETERILLTFDRDVMHYVEEDTLLNPVYDKEKREEELIVKRDQKIEVISKLCRFCLECDEDLIEINKLLKYSINPSEVMPHILITNIEIFNKKACEECFQQIILFDGFRKRCRRSQDLIIEELKRVESEIVKLNGVFYDPNSWLKTETVAWTDDEGCALIEDSQTGPEFHQIIMKQEEKDGPISEGEFIQFDYQTTLDVENSVDENCFEDEDILFPNPKKIRKEKRKYKLKAGEIKDEKTQNKLLAGSPTEISTRYEEDTIDLKDVFMHQSSVIQKCNFYECFFCKLKFGGKDTYARHVCTEKREIRCMVPNCGKLFTALSGFNTHITKLHKLPGITRHFCKFCKLSKTTTKEEFQEHFRKCEINAEKVLDSPVTCEWCSKTCPNMKSYEVHQMFHTGGNTLYSQRSSTSSSKIIPFFKQKPIGVFICETCGKDFAVARNLSRHIQRLHVENLNAKLYTCDKCGKTKKTREEMQKHIRCVHYVNPSTCPICGKTFGNRALLQAHQSRTKHRIELLQRVQQEAVKKMLQPDYFY